MLLSILGIIRLIQIYIILKLYEKRVCIFIHNLLNKFKNKYAMVEFKYDYVLID